MATMKGIPVKVKKGSISNPFTYLLEVIRSVEARVLRGSPEAVLSTIQAFGNSPPYSSFIINFGEDLVSDEIIEETMDLVECFLFAGQEKSNFSYCWIRHEDKQKTELHLIVANIHLSTAKQFVPYFHNRDRAIQEAVITLINHKFGLMDPHDPGRKSLCNVSRGKLSDQMYGIKTALIDHVLRELDDGNITNRQELVDAIRRFDSEITIKEGEDYLLFSKANWPTNIKQTGELYERNFDLETCLAKREKAQEWRGSGDYREHILRAKEVVLGNPKSIRIQHKLGRLRNRVKLFREKFRKPHKARFSQKEIDGRANFCL